MKSREIKSSIKEKLEWVQLAQHRAQERKKNSPKELLRKLIVDSLKEYAQL